MTEKSNKKTFLGDYSNLPIFYAPDALQSHVLPEEESAHAIRVLRLNAGDDIFVVDGKGGFFHSKVILAHQKHCEFQLIEQFENPEKRTYQLHIAIAPTKNIDRFEWFLEKATEIGIDQITPLLTNFSERKIINPKRLEKIIVSASKQSLKAKFPILNPISSMKDFLLNNNAEQKFIAHCYDDDEKKLLKSVCQKNKNTLILIGPEGDFSQEEINLAVEQYQYKSISLGTSRLRTETAGIMACASIQIINQ